MVVSINSLPNITYDANGNILVNGVPIPGTGPVNLDPPPGNVLTNAAGVPYVPSGSETNFDVDRSDAEAVLNSPFAQTNLFSDPDLDGYADDTGDPNLFEDLLLQGADTRKGLNDTGEAMYADPNTGELLSEADYEALYGSLGNTGELTNPNVTVNDDGTKVSYNPLDGITTYFAADGTPTGAMDADGNFTSFVDNNDPPPPGNDPPPGPVTTMDDIANFLTEGGLGSTANFFREGSVTADQVRDYLSGDRLDEFNALMAGFDPNTYTYEGNYSFNPNNPAFGAGSGRETVYAYNPITGEATMMNAAEAAKLGYQTFTTARDLLTAYPQLNPDNTEPEPTPTDTIDYQTLYTNLLNEIANNQQTEPDYGALPDFSLRPPIFRQPSYGIGSFMGYGNPFFGGYGYGYGMNPYAGGIGSFYGNMGSGYSPSMYGSPFYGMYGGQNYNQRPMYSIPYNPYSTLYNQYSSPGFTGNMYTTDYQTYLDTPFEGQKYSQDYQDYLSVNNPTMYNNLFGTA